MLNEGESDVRVLEDGWTVVTVDGGKSIHFLVLLLQYACSSLMLYLRRFGVFDVSKCFVYAGLGGVVFEKMTKQKRRQSEDKAKTARKIFASFFASLSLFYIHNLTH